MTAIGFFCWALSVALLKQEDELFWLGYKKVYKVLNIVAAVGFLLFVLGLCVVLWRVMP